MADFTEHLNLLKKDPVADAADTFNIETMLNENWQKIDLNAAKVNDSLINLANTIAQRAQIVTGTYTGNGELSKALISPVIPLLVMVLPTDRGNDRTVGLHMLAINGMKSVQNTGSTGNNSEYETALSWEGNQLTMSSSKPSGAFNEFGTSYHYAIVGYEEEST